MAGSEWAYVVSVPRVLHEEIDDEIIAIDNLEGTYLSIQGLGVQLWQALVDGVSRADLLEALELGYSVSTEAAAAVVDPFVVRLADVGIVQEIDPRDSVAPRFDRVEISGKMPQAELEIFDDLQHLLLFDPIHETDEEAGWPNPRA